MKTKYAIMIVAMTVATSCKKTDEIVIPEPPITTEESVLSAEEKSDLTFLIQEEKLARDVYAYAYDKYGSEIFNNINSSEQTHMDKVASLLTAYDLENPIIGLNAGEFVNENLQQLYYDLTASVDLSVVDALKVGATIEDLDISDIESLYANTTRSDITSVYDALTCGSRNHLRGYVSNIEKNGATYEVQFLSQTEYQEILSGSHESCGSH